jgi:hypothetical protein
MVRRQQGGEGSGFTRRSPQRKFLGPAIAAEVIMAKHTKRRKPSDADLKGNPFIGGSKGTTQAQVTPDELEDMEGENTIEGDDANDTNPQGGIDKGEHRFPFQRK